MYDWKSIFASKTIWSLIVGGVAVALDKFGYTIGIDDQNTVINGIITAAEPLSLVAAAIFRVHATKQIAVTADAKKALSSFLVAAMLGGASISLAACNSVPAGITDPYQRELFNVLDMQSKYEPVQIAIEAAVTSSVLPADIKNILKTVDKTATSALTAYADAVLGHNPKASVYLSVAISAVQNAATAAAEYGFLKSTKKEE